MPAKRVTQKSAQAAALAELNLLQHGALRAAFEASGEECGQWLRELAATTRAAAAQSEFGPAMKGYELLGKHLGHITDATTQNHLHLHGGSTPRSARSDEELRAELARLEAPAAPDRILDAVAEVVPAAADPYA